MYLWDVQRGCLAEGGAPSTWNIQLTNIGEGLNSEAEAFLKKNSQHLVIQGETRYVDVNLLNELLYRRDAPRFDVKLWELDLWVLCMLYKGVPYYRIVRALAQCPNGASNLSILRSKYPKLAYRILPQMVLDKETLTIYQEDAGIALYGYPYRFWTELSHMIMEHIDDSELKLTSHVTELKNAKLNFDVQVYEELLREVGAETWVMSECTLGGKPFNWRLFLEHQGYKGSITTLNWKSAGDCKGLRGLLENSEVVQFKVIGSGAERTTAFG